MSTPMLRSIRFGLLGQVLALTAGMLTPSPAHADSTRRAVNVIEAPTPPSASAPAPVVVAEQGSGTAIPSTAPTTNVKAANPAGVSVEMSPEREIPVGALVSFRVSSKKEGYLVLLDIDANGKLTQIYPNPLWLINAPGGRQRSNLVKPGKPVLIPDPADHAGFAFVASAPLGTAMIVALLSDRPIHMIDLPDLPAQLVGQADALEHLSTKAHELRIPIGDTGRLQESRWSLDAKFYSVRNIARVLEGNR
jgi:Domain of unknown function (DUF4384)